MPDRAVALRVPDRQLCARQLGLHEVYQAAPEGREAARFDVERSMAFLKVHMQELTT